MLWKSIVFNCPKYIQDGNSLSKFLFSCLYSTFQQILSKNVKLHIPYCIEIFSVFDFFLSSYLCVCVCFKSLLLLPYLPCTTFLPLFDCNSRASYSGNNDLHWYGWNSVTSISIEIDKCIPAQHLFYGQWNITVYVISYPIYTCGINVENIYPHTRRTSVGVKDLTISMRYTQWYSTPRGMRFWRPCWCDCLRIV